MRKVIVKQMVLTIYSDGSTRCTERALAERDEKSGRFTRKTRVVFDTTPMLPGFVNNEERKGG